MTPFGPETFFELLESVGLSLWWAGTGQSAWAVGLVVRVKSGRPVGFGEPFGRVVWVVRVPQVGFWSVGLSVTEGNYFKM